MFSKSEIRRIKGGYKFRWLIREESAYRAGAADSPAAADSRADARHRLQWGFQRNGERRAVK
jgi:hypothetical protein